MEAMTAKPIDERFASLTLVISLEPTLERSTLRKEKNNTKANIKVTTDASNAIVCFGFACANAPISEAYCFIYKGNENKNEKYQSV